MRESSAYWLCIALLSVVVGIAEAAGDDVRTKRTFRDDPPLWQRVLEAPESVVDAVAWPVKRGLVWAERVRLITRVEDVLYFNDAHTAGWFPNVDLGGDIASAVGFQLFHHDLFGNREHLDFATLFAFQDFSSGSFEEQEIGLDFTSPPAPNGRIRYGYHLFLQDDQDQDFFVRMGPGGALSTGRDTGKHDDTSYSIDQVRTAFDLGYALTPALTVGLDFAPIFADVDEGSGGEPPIPATIAGVGEDTILLGGGPTLEWDRRDSPERPRAGWWLRGHAGYWNSIRGHTRVGDDPYRFVRYGAEGELAFGTFRRDRSIFLRFSFERVEPVGGGAVPFWDEPMLDENHWLRAFERYRFRDEGAFVVNAEYRYPIWDTWDGFVFVDEGEVFRNYSDIDLGELEWSAGAGIRMYTAAGLFFRTWYALGPERAILRLGLEQGF